MGTMEVAYTRRGALSSLLVRGLGAGPGLRAWSHCALVLPGRAGVIEALALRGGVVQTRWSEFVSANGAIELVRFEVPNAAAGYAQALADVGRPYDWSGAVGAYFRRDWHRDTARHCVVVVEGALHAAGLRRWLMPPHFLRPNDSAACIAGAVSRESIK